MKHTQSLNPNAPIVRFGRWLETLSVFDLLVVGILTPILGLATVIGPALLATRPEIRPADLLWYSIENIVFGPTILALFCVGVVVALLSRRLGVWAASTAMAGYFLMVAFDLVSGRPGHNLLPFELAMYVILTGFAVAGAAVVALVWG